MSDLDLLEVLNSVGADLLSQTMKDQSETGVIPKAALDAMLHTAKPKMVSKYPRPVGNDVNDLAEHLYGSFPDPDPEEEREKQEAFDRWFEDQELERNQKQEAFNKAMRNED